MNGNEVHFRKDKTTDIPVSQLYTFPSFTEYVESQVSRGDEALITGRTVATFLETRLAPDDGTSGTDDRNIRHWFARLMAGGIKPSSANRYLGKMRSLYAAYRGADNDLEPLFRDLRRIVKDKSYWPGTPDGESLKYIRSIPSRVRSLSSVETMMARLLLFLLYNGGQNISFGIDATLDGTYPDIEQIRTLLDSQRAPRRKFVFALHQGKMRPARIASLVSGALTSLLHRMGARRTCGVTSHEICGWWIEAALQNNIDCETIRAIVPTIPTAHKWLSIVRPKELTEKKRLETMQAVADFFNPMSPQWYVLSLRGRNTPDDIKACIRERAPELEKSVTFFYPTTTRVTREGKKLIKQRIPYIPHILFVKTTPDRVAPFVSMAGHLAWCYKTVNRPDAPYSVIPNKTMVDFQTFIGVFDEDTKIEFVKNTDLAIGRRVRITGGPAARCEGEIIKEYKKSNHPDLRTFVLRITNNLSLKWEVHIEEQYLEPI